MIKKLLVFTFCASVTIACQSPQSNQSDGEMKENPEQEKDAVVNEPENDAPEIQEQGGIKISPKKEVKKFENAMLSHEAELKPQNGEVKFDFTVENYELGVQTTESRMNLANSDKGQHIHLIVDNGPYSAHYEPGFSKKFEDGQHYGIAFLSRSYHESVKNDGAAVTFQFGVNATEGEDEYDMDQPLLFYSRPKGTYSGKGAEKILFDFYLQNAELASDGYSVIAKVNDSLKFEFDEWRPYLIEGLPAGENSIEIYLVDAQGMEVNPDMNHTVRKFTVEK